MKRRSKKLFYNLYRYIFGEYKMLRPFFYLGNNKGLTQLRDGQPFLVNTDG